MTSNAKAITITEAHITKAEEQLKEIRLTKDAAYRADVNDLYVFTSIEEKEKVAAINALQVLLTDLEAI